MSEEERENTDHWAHAGQENKYYHKKDIVGEIETDKMDLQQKSEIFHAVVKSAQQDEKDSRNPEKVEKSSDQIDSERKEQAEEVEAQVMDLEHMKFSARDLNDYSKLS